MPTKKRISVGAKKPKPKSPAKKPTPKPAKKTKAAKKPTKARTATKRIKSSPKAKLPPVVLTEAQMKAQALLELHRAKYPVSKPWIDRCTYIQERALNGSKLHQRGDVMGRPPTYTDPDVLWEMCCEFFQYNQNHPLWETKAAQYQGDPVEMIVPKMAAMTLTGLQLYIGLGKDAWIDYKGKPDFSEVCADAERVIYQQKFQGAAADQLNPAIIARDLGLADKKEVGVIEDNPVTALISQLSGNTIGPATNN